MILTLIKAVAFVAVYAIAWQEKGIVGVVFVLSVQILIANEIDSGVAFAQQRLIAVLEEAAEKFRAGRDN